MADYINREDALKLCRDGKLLSSNAFEKLAIKYIADIPSADVHPVVHGQWINTMPIVEYKSFCQVKCSICGSIEAYGNFCRNCGADMRGEL